MILFPLAFAIAAASGPATVKSGVELWRAGDDAGAVAAWLPYAAQGDAAALFNLGQAYKLGRGVPRDPVIARDYYRRAAEKNYTPAAANLGIALFQAGDKLEAVRWLRQAADRGDARAQYVLGIAAWNGDGLPKNPGLSYGYLLRAQAAGLGEATTALGSIEPALSPQARDAGAAMAASLASGGGVPPALAAAVPTTRTTPVGVQRPGTAPPPPTVAGTFVAGVRNALGLAPVKPTPPVTARLDTPPPARAATAPPRTQLADATPPPARAAAGPPRTQLAETPPPARAAAGSPNPDTGARPVVADARPSADPTPKPPPAQAAAADALAKPPAQVADTSAKPAAADAAARSPAKPLVADTADKVAPKPLGPDVVKPALKAAALELKTVDAAAKLPAKPALADAGDKASPPGWRVQLGAYSSRKLADAAWASVKAGQSGAIGKARPIFDTVGAVVKVQLGPYASRDAARDACSKLAFAGKACFVTQG